MQIRRWLSFFFALLSLWGKSVSAADRIIVLPIIQIPGDPGDPKALTTLP